MRIRNIAIAALLALGALVPTAANAATFCYDVDVVVNGDAVVDESACVPE